MNRPSGLGRGLAALIPATTTPDDGAALAMRELPVGDIVPNPRQPRDVFDEGELALLADSIATMGCCSQSSCVSRTAAGS